MSHHLIDEHGIDRGEITETEEEDSADPMFRRYVVYVLAEGSG